VSAARARALAPVLRFQFGLALICPDCLARFDRLVHLALRFDCDWITLAGLSDIRKVELGVGGANVGFGEAQFAAHDVAASTSETHL
jgi:hypothetical protein